MKVKDVVKQLKKNGYILTHTQTGNVFPYFSYCKDYLTKDCKEVCIMINDFHIEIKQVENDAEYLKQFIDYQTIEQAYDFEVNQLVINGFYAEIFDAIIHKNTWYIEGKKLTNKLVKDITIWGENPTKIPRYDR